VSEGVREKTKQRIGGERDRRKKGNLGDFSTSYETKMRELGGDSPDKSIRAK